MNYLVDLTLFLFIAALALFFIGGMYRLVTQKDTKQHDFGVTITLQGVRLASASIVIFLLLLLGS